MASKKIRLNPAGTPLPTKHLINGVEYVQLDRNYDPEQLFCFNKEHGTSSMNYIPDGPVRSHLLKVSTGETLVWAGFMQDEIVGFISAEKNSEYWLKTSAGSCFVNEFVVKPGFRGKGIGTALACLCVDLRLGIFGLDPAVHEMYATVHEDNISSRTALLRAGFTSVLTYADSHRGRNTTVLKKVRPWVQCGNRQAVRVIGVQSGNAVDGIDVGIFDFEPVQRSLKDPHVLQGPVSYTTLANKTFSFSSEQRKFVLRLREMSQKDGKEYAKANYRLGEWFAEAVLSLLQESGIARESVHLIGSHGQTVCGHPHWELGDMTVIAQRTGITVVGDFRPTDVAAGGNGTPCTCTYDSIMLRPEASSQQWRITINIGGTSSMTFLPPWPAPGNTSSDVDLPPIGLDPGLGVFFMDLCVREINPSLEYDNDGAMARSGNVNDLLLEKFLAYKYYQQTALPIGVGPDDFPEKLFHEWHLTAKELGVSNIDFLCTLVELTAKQVALAAKRFGGPHIACGATNDVLMRGGAMKNSYFVERVRVQMSEQLGVNVKHIKTLADLGIEEESWEQAMYALFGYLCFNNVYNFVPSCTGATQPVVGGKIAPGSNFHSLRLLDCEIW